MPEELAKRYYKLEAGDVVTVHRKEVNNYVFYSLCFKKRNRDNSESYLYKKISFKSGTDIPDKTKIRVLDFFEDGYIPRGSYDTIWTIFIQEYEIVEDAIKEYQEKKKEEEIPNIEIGEDQLPFW